MNPRTRRLRRLRRRLRKAREKWGNRHWQGMLETVRSSHAIEVGILKTLSDTVTIERLRALERFKGEEQKKGPQP